ncbi:trypsin-like peptidase domain-containing protein [Candidatus Saccharibacteria bacterium]|nr:trypsin-like peptidase domain-containing protein [Candidatus Saccharibacteria bacterium]
MENTDKPMSPIKRGLSNPSNTKIILFVITGLALLISLASLACAVIFYYRGGAPIAFNPSNDGNSANFTEGSIADVANKVSPSVVSIITETRTMSFWGQESTSSAAGTGIIVSSDGYVLTNKHVINGANNINVVLDNGTTYDDVSVVTTDPVNDVAFLKIKDASDLTPATLGNSKTISIGQQVIAIGNALGQFQNTVTAGIISGIGRSVTASDSSSSSTEALTDMIQTDASINAGNSGGPLVNAAGEVIGINTAVSADGENIGFAIPISSVKGMLSEILETGSAERAYLGVHYANITPDVAKKYELPVTAGAYVYSDSKYSAVVKDSPAAKAGVKEKDIITAVNGTKVGSAGSVSSLIGEYKPGDTVQLTILRDGKEMTLNVTLGSYKG